MARFADIFEYTEYRPFLGAYYSARKAADRNFSHRFIAKHVHAGSSGWFADIVKGRANLSDTQMLRLTRLLAEYFELLVRFDQAGSLDEKNLLFTRLLAQKGIKPELVGKENFEYYSEWHHSAIRELLFFYDFAGDYAALGKKLRPTLPAADAKRSVLLLEKLGFLRRDAQGRCKPNPGVLKKDPSFRSIHVANLHKANAALAVDSLSLFPKEDRDISAMTLALSEEGFRKAKEELKAMRARLLALAHSEAKPAKVFQCNFHMFPVTE
jgi:uncharacterized protein (TIGR02147 family)